MDMLDDMKQMEKVRALNLVDFSQRREVFCLDSFSDASEHGGMTETRFERHDDFMRVGVKF